MLKHPREKGREFEHLIAAMITDAGFGKSIRTPLSGGGGIPGDVMSKLPLFIECKKQESWKPLKWWQEAHSKSPIAAYPTLLLLSKNFLEPYAFMKFEDLLEIMSYAYLGGWR